MELRPEKLVRDETLPNRANTLLIKVQGNESYLEKIVREAVIAEKRYEGEAKVEAAIRDFKFIKWELEDGSIWVSVDGRSSDFARIMRRVDFRLRNNKWITRKNVIIHTEYFEVPGQFCREHRNFYKEVQ